MPLLNDYVALEEAAKAPDGPHPEKNSERGKHEPGDQRRPRVRAGAQRRKIFGDVDGGHDSAKHAENEEPLGPSVAARVASTPEKGCLQQAAAEEAEAAIAARCSALTEIGRDDLADGRPGCGREEKGLGDCVARNQ